MGTVDDLIITPNDKVSFGVLSVGGCLGVGTKFVLVTKSAMEILDKHIMLRGATKESLKALPEFTYAK